MAKKKIKKKKVTIDPKYIGVPNIQFSLVEPDDKRDKKFAKQRMTRGFDNSETWSLKDTIVNFTLPRLYVYRDLMKNVIGDSYGFYADVDLIIRAFEIAKKDGDGNGIVTKAEWKEYDKGMKAFGRTFMRLWW